MKFYYLLPIILVLFFSCKKDTTEKVDFDPNTMFDPLQKIIYFSETDEIVDIGLMLITDTNIYSIAEILPLHRGPDLSSQIIATFPKYTLLNVIEIGEIETIDGITAPWIKVIVSPFKNNIVGWCFSGYIKPRSEYITDVAARFFTENRPVIPTSKNDAVITSNVVSIEEILPAQGYYIQKGEVRPKLSRSPEILTLTVEDGRVFVREIDIVNEEVVVRNEIPLYFDGNTFLHNNTRLEIQNGQLQIIYKKNITEDNPSVIWDFDMPYTFENDLNASFSQSLQRLSTDYLQSFSGNYVMDSFKIIEQKNWGFNERNYENLLLQVQFNQQNKCLTFFSRYFFLNKSNFRLDFVETTHEAPFFWQLEESPEGYKESLLYFYEGAIVLFINNLHHAGEDNERILNYVVLFKNLNNIEDGLNWGRSKNDSGLYLD